MKAPDGLALIAVVCAGAAPAQELSVGRMIELPAHRALFALLDQEAELKPFETDGCSGGLSTSWTLVADWFPEFEAAHDQLPPWEGCCVTHDRAYHDVGGATDPEASFSARLAADEALRGCVEQTGRDRRDAIVALYDVSPDQVELAYETIAAGMYRAVRLGGGPCSGLPWRWGYGYPQCWDDVSGPKSD